jgi:hypothetical protein
VHHDEEQLLPSTAAEQRSPNSNSFVNELPSSPNKSEACIHISETIGMENANPRWIVSA